MLLCAAPAAEDTSGANAISAHSKLRLSGRSWRVHLTPAPDDLALAQISFPHASRRLSRRMLHAAVSGPFGDDYMALEAVAPSATPGMARALVLIVNRPSPLLDPVSVRLRLTALGALGEAMTSVLENPLARSSPASRPALCDLAHGHALSAAQLSTLGSRGTPLSGFDAANAVAQAYDDGCSLPYESAFKVAVQSSGGGGSPPAPEPQPPSPQPPPPGPPHCIPCDPQPGYACPLEASPSICVASVRRAVDR
ncbi:MAG: hypothetical protein ACRDK2_15780 [Solirubrobacteraceae bacterium]